MRSNRKKVRYLYKFAQISFKEKMFLLEAVYYLLYFEAYLYFASFRSCIKKLQVQNTEMRDNLELLKTVKVSIRRGNKLAFWDNKCLVCSLAARRMLEKRGISSTLHLGVRYASAHEMEAHSWLTVGDFYVIPNADESYKEIYQL